MTSEERNAARTRLQQHLAIAELRPFRMQAEQLANAPELGTALELAVDHSVEVKPQEGGFSLAWRFDLSFTAKSAAHPFARFGYSVAAVYAVPGKLPASEVLADFADTNGFLHVWPYVRSWVQGACGQMQIAALPLPVARFRRELGKPASANS